MYHGTIHVLTLISRLLLCDRMFHRPLCSSLYASSATTDQHIDVSASISSTPGNDPAPADGFSHPRLVRLCTKHIPVSLTSMRSTLRRAPETLHEQSTQSERVVTTSELRRRRISGPNGLLNGPTAMSPTNLHATSVRYSWESGHLEAQMQQYRQKDDLSKRLPLVTWSPGSISIML